MLRVQERDFGEFLRHIKAAGPDSPLIFNCQVIPLSGQGLNNILCCRHVGAQRTKRFLRSRPSATTMLH